MKDGDSGQKSLFTEGNELHKEESGKGFRPLADRMRPTNFDEIVGQDHLIAPKRVFRKLIEDGNIHSMVLWGPPGCGKTTIARLISEYTNSIFVSFSAVLAGVKDVREITKEAARQARRGKRTILFVDEIHRFNRSQQDAFLPHVESGLLTLIGATTENPSFEINSPLLSRLDVYILYPLNQEAIITILERALEDEDRGLKRFNLQIDKDILGFIANVSGGDARRGLNLLERVALSTPPRKDGVRVVTRSIVEELAGRRFILYDKDREEHYNLISAFIKSMRGSDVDASLYYLARMLEGGEDPLFIARRMVIFASEDIGNADPTALNLAVSVYQGVHFIGMPEAKIILAQGVVYLASSPKSNSSYLAIERALKEVKESGEIPIPLFLRNPVTKLMKERGYGDGYVYPHSQPGHYIPISYLPSELSKKRFYFSNGIGFEKKLEDSLQEMKRKAEGAKKGEAGDDRCTK